ncbi:MAG: hypothetical protein QW590_00920 [Candidatus Bilamarchaeaceae archaeon]
MKGQVTMELLLLFLVTLTLIALITPPILQAFSSFSEKSRIVMARAEVENDILAYEIYCNSKKGAPLSDLLSSSGSSDVLIQIEKWVITVERSTNFSGIFEGCSDDKKAFA